MGSKVNALHKQKFGHRLMNSCRRTPVHSHLAADIAASMDTKALPVIPLRAFLASPPGCVLCRRNRRLEASLPVDQYAT